MPRENPSTPAEQPGVAETPRASNEADARTPHEVLQDGWQRQADEREMQKREDPQFTPTDVGSPVQRVAEHTRVHHTAAVGTARTRMRGGR